MKTLFIIQLRARSYSYCGYMTRTYGGEAVLDLTKMVAGKSPVERRCCLGQQACADCPGNLSSEVGSTHVCFTLTG